MPSFHGKPTCSCGAESLPLVEKVMLHLGLIKYSLDIYQLIGGAPQSANTHRGGLVVDSAQCSDAQLRVWRNAGYDASWRRTTAQGFDIEHHHGVARGCPHNSQAWYQIDAVDDGFNGLGRNGRGGQDNGPKPLSGRTWQEGVAWMKTILSQPAPVPAAKPVVSVMNFNVGSPKYFGPWGPRREGFAELFAAWKPDILVCQETHYKYQTADILGWLGAGYIHHSSPVGNDVFRKDDTTNIGSPAFREYALGPQGRAVNVLHLKTPGGRPYTVMAGHAPALNPAYRTLYARRAVNLFNQVDDPRIFSLDCNNESKKASPHKEFQSAGLVGIKDQCAVVNEGQPEFPAKDKWLCDILTKPREARILSGQLILTSPRLSDHRPIWSRVEIGTR